MIIHIWYSAFQPIMHNYWLTCRHDTQDQQGVGQVRTDRGGGGDIGLPVGMIRRTRRG